MPLLRHLLIFALLVGAACAAVCAQTQPATTQKIVRAAPEAQKQTAQARSVLQATEARIEQAKANLVAVKEILSIGLTNDEAGELLREARQRSPSADTVQQRVAARERQAAEARLNRVRLLEERRNAADPAEFARLTGELATQEAYVDAVEAALAAERRLASTAGQLGELLDAQLLWISSAPSIGHAWFGDVVRGGYWLIDPPTWANVGRTVLRRLGETPITSAAAGILIIGLVVFRRRLKDRFANLAERVDKVWSDSFLLTVRAAAITFLLALPGPMLLGGLGRLLTTQNFDPFARAVGQGFYSAAAVALMLDFFRRVCRPHGLAESHFGWNERARRTLWNNLRWLLAIETPAAFVVATCDAGNQELYRQGIGRLAFMLGSLGLTIFVARVFRPGSGVFIGLFSEGGWAWRLRKVWYGLVVLLPASLIVAAAVGYYYTATAVQSRFFYSGVVLLGGVLVYSVLTRWLLVTRRRLAVQQARQKLADQREARQKKIAEAKGDGSTHETEPEVEAPAVDVAAASEQTTALLGTLVAAGVLAAIWGVWNDILPALANLKNIQLTASGAGVLTQGLSLWSLLLGLLAVALTFIAARNLPAVLELAVLERFPLDNGIRYAATTLTRYATIAAGIVVTSNVLGIDWSRAQWIIAALGVGLGFGLQEIVANFVSGLIILFERPVRVGDFVTVGDISGTVSRLQIRATTITDLDNKEVLVPNKSFITDRVVNWTLSNPISRLVLQVGVAYGSDMPKAIKAVADAVRDVPAVLKEPAPSVLFLGFGDSSLDLEVRAYINDLTKRFATRHELHMAINAGLEKAGVEIPFPQRDLHLRSSDIGELTPGELREARDAEYK